MELLCKWCGETKPAEEFHKRKAAEPYSQSNVRCCRQCNTERNRLRYQDPSVRSKQLKANAKWRVANRDKQRESEKRFIERKPDQMKARNRIGYLIRHGKLSKQPCCICGADGVEAHHDSYAKEHWETIRWLCKDHHEAWHKMLDPVKAEILEEPMALSAQSKDRALGYLRQIQELRALYRAEAEQADALEKAAWYRVLEAANQLWPSFKQPT